MYRRSKISFRDEEDKGGGRPKRQTPKLVQDRKYSLVLLFLLLTTDLCTGLDVHFDDPASGFFLRDASTLGSTMSTLSTNDIDKTEVKSTTSIVLGENDVLKNFEPNKMADILHSSSFTVLKSARPITIRAQYGPFQARQTVPTQYLVPDLSDDSTPPEKDLDEVARQQTVITDFKPHQLDLSAHLVTKSISKDYPVLRVLFHSGRSIQYEKSRSDSAARSGRATLCAVMTASLEKQQSSRLNSTEDTHRTLSAVCTPDSKDGACLAELTLPALWWPSMTQSMNSDQTKTLLKQPKTTVRVSYSVFETHEPICQTEKGGKVSLVPDTPVGSVPLVFPSRGYRQLAKDEILHMLLPQTPIYPNSKIFVPVFLEQPRADERGPVVALTIKCRTKGGFRIRGVEMTSRLWMIRSEINSRGTVATVNVFKKSLATTLHDSRDKTLHPSVLEEEGPQELFNWLIALDDRDYEMWDKGRISWHVRYQRTTARAQRVVDSVDSSLLYDQSKNEDGGNQEDDLEISEPMEYFSRERYRLVARLPIQKDYVQAVVPITKSSEIVNLAVLTGRQISKPLKIFIVSHGGEVADVTLNSLCTSKDQSVLKVSSSCTSVSVDGSETYGAISAEVDVKYGQQMGKAEFTVWFPEMPVSIDIPDPRLSLIKGWKVPDFDKVDVSTDTTRRKVMAINKTHDDANSSTNTCALRYQQTKVSVYAKFLAEDSNSGRREYFPSRGMELDVTELLVGRALRVADSKVASLHGNILQGLAPGKTELQVLSPITGHVIGVREIKVAKNKETIREMRVRLLSGLSLKVQSSLVGQRGKYSVTTSYSQILTSKYQEGLLDIELVMSDDTVMSLRDLSPAEYYLGVNSLEPRIIAFAPNQEARYPRVIAVSSGHGKLLRVSLELVDSCAEMTSSDIPLAVTDVDVIVKIHNQKKDFLENLWIEKSSQSVDQDANLALQDDQSYIGKPVVSNGIFDSSSRNADTGISRFQNTRIYPHKMTPLEIGMYILLAVFCAAMAIFVASCFVYASKFRRQEYPVQSKLESIQNAHDWVWLGKPGSSSGSSKQSSVGSQLEMNITSNPRQDDLSGEENRQPLVGTTSSSRSRHRTMARGHLPPPGHPAHGAPQFQNVADLSLAGQYQNSHRYHQQMLMQRPQRYLPAPPVHQRLSPVYQNNNNILNTTFDRYELELLQREHKKFLQMAREEEERHQARVLRAPNVISNPVEDTEVSPRPPKPEMEFRPEAARRCIDSSTFTKKNISPSSFGSSGRENLILPVGYPYYAESSQNLEISTDDVSTQEVEDFRREVKRSVDLSPLDLLPDPADVEVDPLEQLRQSPASALPPVSIEEREELEAVSRLDLGDYIPMNPDINRPSPPRQGSSRLFENPFDLNDEESVPLSPQKLSPSHLFESTTLEEELLREKNAESLKPVFDSRTFVIKKKGSPSSSGSTPVEQASKFSQEENSESCENFMKDKCDRDQDDDEDEAAMDYDSLMAYFESLKESTA